MTYAQIATEAAKGCTTEQPAELAAGRVKSVTTVIVIEIGMTEPNMNLRGNGRIGFIMSDEIGIYKDIDGNPRTIYGMITHEPDWIANRFKLMEKEVQTLEVENKKLREALDLIVETEYDDKVESLIIDDMVYVAKQALKDG